MSRSARIFFACALGAGIGAMIALELDRGLFWLGILAGGFVGYFAYEFKTVVSAIPRAWRKAKDWRPDWEWWKVFFKAYGYGLLFVPSGAAGIMILPTVGIGFESGFDAPLALFLWVMLFSTPFISIGFGLAAGHELSRKREALAHELEEFFQHFRMLAW